MITRRDFLKGTAAALGLAGCKRKSYSKRIAVYNWPYYMSPFVLREFETKYGIQVVHATYETGSDEELPAALALTDRIDVIVPGQEVLEELIRRRMLLPLDHARLPQFANILRKFRDLAFDPGNKYSVPYLWGTTGLGVNLGKVLEAPSTWNLLWIPAVVRRISLLASPTEVLAALLKMLGYSVNGASLEAVMKAGSWLLEHRGQGPVFLDQTIGPLTSGKIWVAHAYSGDVLQARRIERTIAYLLPEEGAPWWIDSLCIPAKAPHPEEAHLFIDFLLDGEISAMLSNELWYANPNGAAFKHIRPEVLKDPGVYPRKEILDRCELKRGDMAFALHFAEYWKKIQEALGQKP